MFTPESTVDVQMALGSDIAMVLDECIPYPATPEEAAASTDRTVRWARRCHQSISAEAPRPSHCFPSFRAECTPNCAPNAQPNWSISDAKGYAIGGLSVGEPRPLSLEMVEVTAPMLPKDQPRYVMGVGLPENYPNMWRGAST